MPGNPSEVLGSHPFTVQLGNLNAKRSTYQGDGLVGMPQEGWLNEPPLLETHFDEHTFLPWPK